jgi:hypothetical protein
MLKGSVLVTYAALAAAEFVRGVGLIASGALTYGLLGGALPAEGGYDRIVAYAAFATIALGALDLLVIGVIAVRTVGGSRVPRAQIVASLGLSLLLILAGGPLTPQVAMLVLAALLALAIRLGGATPAANG